MTSATLAVSARSQRREAAPRLPLNAARLAREIARACTRASDVSAGLASCAEVAARALNVSLLAAWCRPADSDGFELAGAAGPEFPPWFQLPERVSPGDGSFLGQVLIDSRPVAVERSAAGPFDVAGDAVCGRWVAVAVVPLISEGVTFGLLAAVQDAPTDGFAAGMEAVAAEIAAHYSGLARAAAVHRQLRLCQAVLHASPVAIVGLDLEERVTVWNAAARHLFGWPAEHAVGERVPLVPGRARAPYEACIHEALAGRATRHVRVVGQRWDGGELPIAISAEPVLDTSGGVNQVLLMIADQRHEDLQRKCLEAELAVAFTLAHSGSFALAMPPVLQAVCAGFDFGRAECWLLDETHAEWTCAGVWQRPDIAFRGTDAEATPLPCDGGLPGAVRQRREIAWLPGLSEAPLGSSTNRAVRSGLHDALGVPVVIDQQVEAVLLFFAFEIPQPDALANVTLAGIAAQVSQFLSAQRVRISLRQAEENQRQSQKMEAIGRLAGGIAHDFNNLLTIILGYAELAAEGVGPGSAAASYVAEIERAGERAAALTRQLLALSRRELLDPVVLSLNAKVREVQNMLGRLVGESIQIDYQLADDLHFVKADAAQIEQALLNLVANARDALPGGGRITIATRNITFRAAEARRHPDARPGDYAALVVSDTGTGMDAETLARLFEPFFTTKERGRGTGLGLSTVYGAVRQSAGFITVDSEPGRGTAFTIHLPRTSEALLTMSIDSAPSSAEAVGTETVLVVEDDDVLRGLVAQVLSVRGYRVWQACDGAAALELLARERAPLDLLLTDVLMPGLPGTELAARVRAAQPRVCVLCMSAYVEADAPYRDALESGLPLLRKPFTSAQLAVKVRQVLDGGAVPATRPAAPTPPGS